MPLVKAQCDNCQGLLEVDPSLKAAICPYCGTPYIVQEAIVNYHNHYEVHDDRSAKARLEAAETYMKLRQYENAYNAFGDVTKLTPQDYRGWWGQVRAITEEFSVKLVKKTSLDTVQSLYDSALIVAPKENRGELERKFEAYYPPLLKAHNALRKELETTIERCNQGCESTQRKLDRCWKVKVRFEQASGFFPKLMVWCMVIGVATMVFFAHEITKGGMVLTVGPAVLLALRYLIIRPIRRARNKAMIKSLSEEQTAFEQKRIAAQHQLLEIMRTNFFFPEK